MSFLDLDGADTTCVSAARQVTRLVQLIENRVFGLRAFASYTLRRTEEKEALK